MPGSPNVFMSHSFSCGLNAGTYGGRGGVGISLDFEQSLKCLKNSMGRMNIYGDPFLPLISGSKGAPNKVEDRYKYSSPSNIAIVSLEMKIYRSKITATPKVINENKHTNISSGGGLLVIYNLFDGDQSSFSANGMGSESEYNGAGGGGRINSYDLCWNEKFYSHRYSKEDQKKQVQKNIIVTNSLMRESQMLQMNQTETSPFLGDFMKAESSDTAYSLNSLSAGAKDMERTSFKSEAEPGTRPLLPKHLEDYASLILSEKGCKHYLVFYSLP
jgi:hypothetical protein